MLASPIAVANTLAINNGSLTDNGKNVSFKNVSIADNSGALVSTATWTQNANGGVTTLDVELAQRMEELASPQSAK